MEDFANIAYDETVIACEGTYGRGLLNKGGRMNGASSITLVQLVHFCKLAEVQHVTRAAKALYIAQPTLSASVKALERELGVPLFYYEGRSIRLTESGKEFYKKVSPFLSILDSVVADMRARGSAEKGCVRIGTIPTIQHDFIPTLLQSFWQHYGYEVKVEMTVEFTLPLTQGLKKQDYDVIFASRVPTEANIEYIPMMSKPMTLVAHESHSLARESEIELAQLARESFVTYGADTPLGREVASILDPVGAKPVASFSDEFTLISFILANRGVAGFMLDTFAIDRFDGVKRIAVQGVPENLHIIYLGYDRRVFRSRVVSSFVETARNLSSFNIDASKQ